MHTYIKHIYTHHTGGEREKDELEEVEKEEEEENTTRKMGNVKDTGMKCLILFCLLQKKKTEERKKRDQQRSCHWVSPDSHKPITYEWNLSFIYTKVAALVELGRRLGCPFFSKCKFKCKMIFALES